MLNKPLKICLIGSAQSIHIQRWGAFLASRGHEVHILSNFSGQVRGAKVWPLCNKKRYGNLAYLLSLPRVYRLLRMLHPDITHFHYIGGSSLYSLVLNHLELPAVVVTPWGSDIYSKQIPIKKMFIKRLLERADEVLTTSESMSDVIRESFGIDPVKIVTYSWGIDLKLFRPVLQEERVELRAKLNIPRESFVIFSNRSMAPLYRIELIINAFLKAQRRSPDLFLVVLEGPAGDKLKNNYQKHIRKLIANARGKIKLLEGFVPPDLISKYLAISDTVVSIPVSDQKSTSVLEALASCPIVILSNIAPYRKLQDEGYRVTILPQVSEKDLQEALLAARVVPICMREQWLERNHRIILQRENWEEQAIKIEKEYYKLLNQGCSEC